MILIIGNACIDHYLRLADGWPGDGERLLVRDRKRFVGGNGANVAAGLVGFCGESAALIAMVGDDSDGEWIASELASVGAWPRRPVAPLDFDLRANTAKGHYTGESLIRRTSSGEPQIVHLVGAGERMGAGAIESWIAVHRGGAPTSRVTWIHLCGLGLLPRLEREIDRVAKLIQEMRRGVPELQVSVDVNLLSDGDPTGWLMMMDRLLDVSNFIFPNYLESCQLSGHRASYDDVAVLPHGSGRAASAERLGAAAASALRAEMGKRALTIVVKQGVDGCTFLAPGGRPYFVGQLRRVLNPVDATGAGDAWAAGFIAGVRGAKVPDSFEVPDVDGVPPTEETKRIAWACVNGNRVAARCVSKLGAISYLRHSAGVQRR